MLTLPTGRAICYSGYREGQSPGEQRYPTLAQIRQDLRLLQPHWRLLRLYDCSPHAQRVLRVIRQDRLDFQVMLGAYLGAEVNNPGCPWGTPLTDAQLAASTAENEAEVGRLIALARQYEDIVFSVAVGNEATVDWTDHLVPVPRMVAHVRRVRQALAQPVTFCENYVPWQHALRDLVDELDFISVHTYPVWEHKTVHEALDYTRANIDSVARCHPGKPLVITEAGWPRSLMGAALRRTTPRRRCKTSTCASCWPGPMLPACCALCSRLSTSPGKARPTLASPRSTGACSPSTASPSR